MSSNKPIQALFNAVSESKLRLVRLLVEGGVSVDTRNDRGQTPLLIACSSVNNACHTRGETRESVVKYLIAAGADVNAYDVTGRTSLIYVVITQAQASVIFDIIDAGADLWWDDNSHKCAFDYALQQQNIGQVQLIVDAYKRKNMRGLGIGTSPIEHHLESASHDVTSKQNKKLMNTRNKHESNKKLKSNLVPRKRPLKSISTSCLVTFGSNKNEDDNAAYFKNPERINKRQDTHSSPTSDEDRNPLSSGNLSINPPIMTQSFPHCYLKESTDSLSTFPTQSFHQIHENTYLCDLCKSVFSNHHLNDDQVLNAPNSSCENLKAAETPEPYRRRSTGSLLGRMKKHYEAIRKKRGHRSSASHLSSDHEIGVPGKHPSFATSFNVLLVPGTDYLRSRSISIPPLKGTTSRLEEHMVNMLCSRALSRPSSVQLGSEYDSDEILNTHCSFGSMTSSPDDDCSSQRDVTSPHVEESSDVGKRDNMSEACSSPIPTIVLTDYVNSDRE